MLAVVASVAASAPVAATVAVAVVAFVGLPSHSIRHLRMPPLHSKIKPILKKHEFSKMQNCKTSVGICAGNNLDTLEISA
jgi:hypothetical protein